MTMRRALGRIVALWRPHSARLLFGTVVSLAALAAALLLLGASGARLGLGAAVASLVVLRFAGVARVVLRYGERLATHDATFRALADVRVWFFAGLVRLGGGGIGMGRTGDLLSRLVGDVEALDGLYLRILVPLAGLLVLIPAVAFVGFRVSPGVGVVAGLLVVTAGLVLPTLAASRARLAGQAVATGRAGLRTAALDMLSGLREVRAFGAGGRMLALAQAREAEQHRAERVLARRLATYGGLALLCGQLATVAVLTQLGRAPLGAVLVALLVFATAFETAGALARAGANAGLVGASAERLVETADQAAPLPDPVAPAPSPAGTALRFEAIRFGWDSRRAPTLDGFSLSLPEGMHAALVGPSGSGKSTLAALALKVAVPSAGRVLLGGTDIADLAAETVRARIGWLSQTSHLFDDTLRANLLLARPDATEPMVWDALAAAGVADFVRTLPDGLDSWLGEGGATVSGGQARRLALARALLSPAPVLLLDEPCAGLDAATERAFYATLADAARGRSVLLLVHRLTGSERIERVWRLQGGRAVAAAS